MVTFWQALIKGLQPFEKQEKKSEDHQETTKKNHS